VTVDITLSGPACDHPVITGPTASASVAPCTACSSRRPRHGAVGDGRPRPHHLGKTFRRVPTRHTVRRLAGGWPGLETLNSTGECHQPWQSL